MSDCGDCGHPEVIHGGWARPDGSCGYQGCSCNGYLVEARSKHGDYNGWCRVQGIPVKAKDCPDCVAVEAP